MEAEITERVAQALASWRKSLLDLGRKNPLLYYRARKTSSLEVSSPDVFAVVDELDEDGSGWEVFLPPMPSDEAQDEAASLPADGDANENLFDPAADVETDSADASEAREMPTDAEEGVLVFAPKGRKDLEKRLRNLRRRSETDLNERGVHVLYLAAGFLEWKDPSSNEAVQSPLILFPVSLEQESLFDPWRVSPAGEEEILLNPALRQKMLQDFHLALPDLPPADEADRSDGGALCRQYYEDVRQCLLRSALTGWRVIESGILDLFSFHKLVMYRDLEQNAGRAASHDVIRGFASQAGGEAATSANGGFPDDKELDRRLPYKDQFHVLDADSSQLAVLEAARKGTSMVLQGPPGTGKSQTIANLIAQSVADGRRVLFVSEKMAALKVVKKRLTDAGLDDLCLELHSHKTNRKLVVEQLARSLDESLIVEGASRLSGEDLARLEERRRALREYVEELHRRREPLGRSVGSVLGELAGLHAAPARPLADVDAIKFLDADAFVAIQQFIDTIGDYWPVVQEGEAHPWHGLRPDTHGFQLTVTLENELQILGEVLTELRDRGSELAGQLGYSAPKAAATTFGLADLARLLGKSPGVWKGLFTDPGGNNAALGRGRLLSVRAGQLRSRVVEYFPATEPDAPPTADDLWRVLEDLKVVLAPFGVGVPLPTGLGLLAERLRAISGGVERLQQAVKVLSVELGLTAPVEDGGKLRGLVSVCRAILAGRPFSEGFFVAESLRTARARLRERSCVWVRGAEARAVALEVFDESVLDLDLKRFVEAYRTRYQGPMRFLRPSFYRDRKLIRGAARRALEHGETLPALERSREAQLALGAVAQGLGEDLRAFGALARGIDTDGNLLSELLGSAEELLQMAPEWPMPPKLAAALCAQGLLSPSQRAACEGFLEAADVLLARLGAAEYPMPTGTLVDVRSIVADLGSAATSAASQLERAAATIANCLTAGRPDPTWETLRESVAALEGLRDAERRLAEFGKQETERLGAAFQGEATDWESLGTQASFVSEVVRRTSGRPTARIVEIVGTATPVVSSRSILDAIRPRYDGARNAIVTRFLKGTLASADSVDRTPFDDTLPRLEALKGRLDDVDGVLAVSRAEEDLRRIGFHRNVAAFLDRSLSAVDFRKGLRRSILQTWIDVQGGAVPILQAFDGRRHDNLVKEFRTLETRFLRSGTARILDRVGDRTTDGSAGEVRIIRQEAAKRRRHIPLRKLFAEAYTIIPRLKPCLLMSPLSVSQFLKDSPIQFDVVVFDEASQIFTEDSIGAVMRGRQLVVAGDEKQLPPTNFFQATQSGDGDDSEGQEQPEDQPEFESVLAACSTILPHKMLKWHYRSRHENLIAFSNSRFYENRLVTFPSATDGNGDLGVKWEYVAEGVYDRGRSKTNTREALRIVELVVNHWRQRPGDSLGVVTLSQAQMDRVDDLLQERVRAEHDLEGFYSQEGDEAFFVKNLENVQGDERDHIILGIGYGRDSKGSLASNFGPLNRTGGERRLNVAITRAKRRLTAVASFRYSELAVSATSPAGVRQLQKFLEFAERGVDVLQTSNVGTGDTESPLEEAIAAFLVEKGFSIELQVGCSGFRLDIGVRDPAQPGRFILGVECDGATYHSAATVRDRDRLRQFVLEQHGWRIHRIWGPDWIRRRAGEEIRLLDAVSKAAQAPQASRLPVEPAAAVVRPVRIVPRNDTGRSSNEHGKGMPVGEFMPAKVVVSRPLSRTQPHEAPLSEIACLLANLAIAENGVAQERAFKLITKAWDVQRVGHRIRARFEEAFSALPSNVKVDGDFILPTSYQPAVLRPGPNPAEQREFVHIPVPELLLAIRLLLERNGVMSRTELEREVTGLYNVAAALRAREWLAQVMEEAVRKGLLVLIDHRVQLTQ